LYILFEGAIFKEAKLIKSYLVLLFVACFLFSLSGEAKTKQAARKVVRLNFDQPPAPKAKKQSRSIAKAETPRKMFKSISCHNGFIVGDKAYCAIDNPSELPSGSLSEKAHVKRGRTVASASKTASKKFK
jgi:hypothetical protein